MDRSKTITLIKKSLRVKHKLKVFESTQAPDNHEDLAALYFAQWELEDELRAIEQCLQELRLENIHHQKKLLMGSNVTIVPHPESKKVEFGS